jgi:DHA2 family multidrug resistance protein-like MFS transporter
MSVADRLPDPLAADLLVAARDAFTQGLHLAAIVSAALVLGTAVLTLVLLRHGGHNVETMEANRSTVEVEESGGL